MKNSELSSLHRVNSLVIKVTDNCNLDCLYCYRKKNSQGRSMNLAQAVQVVDRYLAYCATAGISEAHFVWHGGEPLLKGVEYYRSLVAHQSRVSQELGVEFRNAIQTNGTLIDEAWTSLFADCRFTVGISLDGPQDIFTLNRGKTNVEAHARILEGIDHLKAGGVPFSFLAVVSEDCVDRRDEIIAFLAALGPTTVDFIPCYDHDSPLTLSPERYAEFMIGVFDLWMSDFRQIRVGFLNDVLKKIVAAARGRSDYPVVGCELSLLCGQNPAVLADGELYPCACLTPFSEYGSGNIFEHEIKQVLDGEGFKRFFNQFLDRSEDCDTCSIYAICGGGCFNRRLPALARNKDYYCSARFAIINHVLTELPGHFPGSESYVV